jgi:predicted NBD/HSP70 family sugar kinase
VLIEAEALLRENELDATLHQGRAIALLLKRAAGGDERCARTLAAAGEALGFAVASLITLFAPPMVIISGRAMATSDHFIAPLRKTVAALLPASLADVSDIVVREWSDETWVRGAAAMTLRDLYGAPWGTTGPASVRDAPAPQVGEL